MPAGDDRRIDRAVGPISARTIHLIDVAQALVWTYPSGLAGPIREYHDVLRHGDFLLKSLQTFA